MMNDMEHPKDEVKSDERFSTDERTGETENPKSYYYDDSTNYEIYHSDNDDEETDND